MVLMRIAVPSAVSTDRETTVGLGLQNHVVCTHKIEV
jgi:hypothetical protein